ncbi:hypothetical protein ACFQVA_25110 [Actinomadura keratinilytica]
MPAQGGKPEDGAKKADGGDEEAADGEDAAVVSTGVKLRKVGKREGVDQPTAVFRAPKSGPEVDQPTTMLKVGDAKPKPEAEDEPEAEKGAGGESEAERTSKFVPLRGLDGPAAVKPKPAEPKPRRPRRRRRGPRPPCRRPPRPPTRRPRCPPPSAPPSSRCRRWTCSPS